MRKLDKTIAFIFLFLISFPLLDELIHILPENVNNEKRDIENNKEFIDIKSNVFNYVTNFENNFKGRSMLVNGYISLKKLLPGNSPLPQKVIVGKNDYYYLVDYNSMDDYRNVKSWESSELENLVKTLKQNNDFLKKQNIPYLIVIVPEKQKIYPEFLPNYITKVKERSRLDEFKRYLEKNKIDLDILDLTSVLIENNQKDLYLKKDSHWNYMGAYLGFRELIAFINKNYQFSFDDKRTVTIFNHKENDLDLAKLMGESFYNYELTKKISFTDTISLKSFESGFDIPEYIRKRKPNFVIAKKNEQGEKKLLMFRDSYSGYWSELYFHTFEESILVWKYKFDRSMVDQFNPDIVIQQVAERHIDFLNK